MSAPLANAASSANLRPSQALTAKNSTIEPPSIDTRGMVSPTIALSGQSAPAGRVKRGSRARDMASFHRPPLRWPPRMLRSWLPRKKAAPITAAMAWATARVRRGPIARNRAVASNRPRALEIRARAASTP